MIRVMISPDDRPDPTLRVDATLGLGFHALPVFEQERIVDQVLAEARERVIARVIHREPEVVPT